MGPRASRPRLTHSYPCCAGNLLLGAKESERSTARSLCSAVRFFLFAPVKHARPVLSASLRPLSNLNPTLCPCLALYTQARDLRRLTLEMLRQNSKDAKAAFKKDVVPVWFSALDRYAPISRLLERHAFFSLDAFGSLHAPPPLHIRP